MMLRSSSVCLRLMAGRSQHTQAASVQTAPTAPHTPVMVKETLQYLQPRDDNLIIDMTFGAGGHTRKILEAAPKARIFALDCDPVAQERAEQLQAEYPGQIIPLRGRFSDLPALLKTHNVQPKQIDGILFDFGCSSMQFDQPGRGFSLSKNGPLDMRMDQSDSRPSAADILAKANVMDLARIFKVYGEEKMAKRIARAIVDARYACKPIETTKELADLVSSCTDSNHRLDKLQRHAHPATKVFQALRIFVNNELNEINFGMLVAGKYLKVGGRMIAITFHSLEDTIVKRHLTGNVINDAANVMPLKFVSYQLAHDWATIEQLKHRQWQQLHKNVIVPGFEEVEENPRSRSAKLRAAIKIC